MWCITDCDLVEIIDDYIDSQFKEQTELRSCFIFLKRWSCHALPRLLFLECMAGRVVRELSKLNSVRLIAIQACPNNQSRPEVIRLLRSGLSAYFDV